MLFMLGGAVLLALSILGEVYQQKSVQARGDTLRRQLEGHWESLIHSGRSWLEQQPDTLRTARTPQAEWAFFIYQEDSLLAYNNHHIRPYDPQNEHHRAQFLRTASGNGLWIQLSEPRPERSYHLLLPVVIDFPVNNPYLQPAWPLMASFDLRFSTTGRSGYQPLSVSVPEMDRPMILWVSPQPSNLWVWNALFILGLVSWCVGFMGGMVRHRRRFGVAGLWMLLGSAGYLLCWKVIRRPEGLFDSGLFSSEIYASSPFLSSFGDALLAFAGMGWIVYWLHLGLQHMPLRRFSAAAAMLLFLPLSLASLRACRLLWEGLVVNSNTFLDLHLIHRVDAYGLVTLGVALLLGAVAVGFHRSVLHTLFDHLGPPKHQPRWFIVALVVVAGASAAALLLGSASSDGLSLLLLGLLWMPPIALYRGWVREDRLSGVLLWSVAVVLGITLSLQQGIRIKERETRQLFAYKLVSDQDGLLEYLIMQRLPRMQSDPLVQQFFRYGADSVRVEAIAEHLRSYHFDGYLSNYQTSVFARGAATFSMQEWLQQRFGGQYVPAGSRDLYFLYDINQLATYYLRIMPPDSVRPAQNDQLVVRFRPENQTRSSIFTDLLFGRKEGAHADFPDYAYAIYRNGRLQQQKGYYAYPSKLEAQPSEEAYRFYQRSGFSHLRYRLSEGATVQISLPQRGLPASATIFATLLLSALLVAALFYLGSKIRWKAGDRFPVTIQPLPLHGRIRMVLVSLSVVTLIIVYWATARFLKQDFKTQERHRLIDKVLEADRQLRQLLESRAVRSGGSAIRMPGNQKLKDLARRVEADINWYAPSGVLQASSQPNLVDRQVLPALLHPEAQRLLTEQHQAFVIEDERIGRLQYQSAYRPLYLGERLYGFVGIPYYSQEILLREELSQLIVNLLHWYVLALGGILFLSFFLSDAITRPLQLIGERLQKVDLNRPPEPIHWKGKDELGQLITHYNAMIEALKQSAQQLARQEREQAWQHMARQVAHEIKNPLTPMKLNLQQLERARQENPERMIERFPAVSRLLIRQIDQLTRIANEFSHFAKMPQGEPRALSVPEFLEDMRQLFEDPLHYRIETRLHDTSTGFVWADRDHLSRLFSNLLKNAVQALPEDAAGHIRLQGQRLELEDKIWWRLDVIDNGRGIAAETLKRIFQPNFSTKSSGMGLGLSMCHRIATLYGGHIEVASTEGQGACFSVWLPGLPEGSKLNIQSGVDAQDA